MTDNLPPELVAKIEEANRHIEALREEREHHVKSVRDATDGIEAFTRIRDAYVEAAEICRFAWQDTAQPLATDADVRAVLAEFQKAAETPSTRNGLDIISLVNILQIPAAAVENAIGYLERNAKIDLTENDGWWRLHAQQPTGKSSADPKKRRSPTETREAVLDVFKREPISVWSVGKLIAELQIPAAAIDNAIGYLERNVKIDLVEDGWWRLRAQQPTEAPIATRRIATFVSAHEPPKAGETEEQRFARIEDFIMRCGDSGANPDQLRTIHATPGDLNYLITKGVVKVYGDGHYYYVPQPPAAQFDPLADLNAAAADC